MNLMAGQWKTPWSAQSLCKFIETGAFRRRLSVLSESHCELPHHANASACCWRGLLPCWVWADAWWGSVWGAATTAMPLGYQLDGRTLLKLIWHHILKPLEPWTSDKGCTCQQIPAVILLLWKMPLPPQVRRTWWLQGNWWGVASALCAWGTEWRREWVAGCTWVSRRLGECWFLVHRSSSKPACGKIPCALFCWCQGWEVKEGVAEL